MREKKKNYEELQLRSFGGCLVPAFEQQFLVFKQ